MMSVWMVYDREGLARNEQYVSMFRRHFRAYGREVEAVLDDQAERRVLARERPFQPRKRTTGGGVVPGEGALRPEYYARRRGLGAPDGGGRLWKR